MEDKQLIDVLHTLKSVKPSDRLVKRIELLKHHLPKTQKASVFPFALIFSMTMVLVLLVIGSSAMIFNKAQQQPRENQVGHTKAPQNNLTLPTNTPIPVTSLAPILALPSSTPTPTPTPSEHQSKNETAPSENFQDRIQEFENNLQNIFKRNDTQYIKLHSIDVKGDSTQSSTANSEERNSGKHED